MKVLHLHAGRLYGGVETFLLTLARDRDLCPAMEHHFGMCFEMRLTDELRAAHAPVTMLGEARFKNPFSILQTRANLRRMIEQSRPDVAICHMSKPLWLFGPVLRRLKIPVVFYVHGPIPAPLDLFDKMARKGPLPDLLIGVSDHTVQTAKDLMFPKATTGTINYPMPFPESHYAITPAARAELRTEFSTSENETVIFQAARMNEWKGQKNLLAALALLRDEPGWVHWMAGGAQSPEEIAYADSLKQMARELKIDDRVRFLGQRSDVTRLLSASDLYCQANNASEGFSLSFTEAFSAGLPIVTTDIGSAREVVTPDCGALTPLHDAPALADALKAMVRDPGLCRRKGEAGRKRIRMLSDPAQQVGLLHRELTRAITLRDKRA